MKWPERFETVREEELWAALNGIYETVSEYAPSEDGPVQPLRYVRNDKGSISIERELRIAKEVLADV